VSAIERRACEVPIAQRRGAIERERSDIRNAPKTFIVDQRERLNARIPFDPSLSAK
jgi:hypothetical protein